VKGLAKIDYNLSYNDFENQVYDINVLQFAASKGYLNIIQLILEKDISQINSKSKNGETALHLGKYLLWMAVMEFIFPFFYIRYQM